VEREGEGERKELKRRTAKTKGVGGGWGGVA